MFAYIDEYILVSPKDTANHHFDTWAYPEILRNKHRPCSALTCLGIRIDLDAKTLSIDSQKLQSISEEQCIALTEEFQKDLN